MIIFILVLQIAPPESLKAYDTPADDGTSITLEWKLSPDDAKIQGYEIYRASEDNPDEFIFVKFVPNGVNKTQDKDTAFVAGKKYFYKIRARGEGEIYSGFTNVAVAIPRPQWFNVKLVNVLVATLLYTFIIVFFIRAARRGVKLFIRRIPGLDALEEAVGRATEMGKPVLFVPGISSISDIATIAALNILGRVAKKTAEYETRLIVPNIDPIVMTVAQEVVRQAYTEAGRPDIYRKEDIFFLTSSQFAYAAGVDGIMMRERPATNLFMGWFAAESLILAEAGNMTGAIQIAGTDSTDQLPFFIVSCDYTIMGEELYAASAYLSREPLLLGTVKGQDLGKAILMFLLVLGSIFGLFGSKIIYNLFNLP